MQMNGRIDGHLVQGHVDTTAKLSSITDTQGSWLLEFSIAPKYDTLLVNKGSVTLNGISLTLVNVKKGSFTTAIIPYTWQNTNIHCLKPGDHVNIEFDILGKYVH